MLQGQPIKATIDARYYFGEPVANAKVKWVVHTSTYWPMGRSEDEDQAQDNGGEGGGGDDNADSDDSDYGGDQERRTAARSMPTANCRSRSRPRVDNKTAGPGLSHRSARHRCRQSRNLRTRLRAGDLWQLFPDGRANSYVYTKGSTATITVTAQDYDKKPVQTAFRVEMNRWDWRKGAGRTITTTQGQTDASGKAQVKLTIPDSGEFRVRVDATTPEKRDVETTPTCGRRAQSPWWSGTEQERMQIVADKKSYQPGDTAHVLIVTGKEPASVLVTAEGNGLYSGQVIKSNGGSIAVDVPIKPEYAPNFYVGAVFIRGNKLYQGSKSLSVPPTQHELNVQLVPSKPQYQPGEAASYTIKATDSSGKPVVAEFSLGVVDEAIYAIKPETVRHHHERVLREGLFARSAPTRSLTYYFSGQAGKRTMQLAAVRRSKRWRS